MVEILICLFWGLELALVSWIEACEEGSPNFRCEMFQGTVSLGSTWFFVRKNTISVSQSISCSCLFLPNSLRPRSCYLYKCPLIPLNYINFLTH